MGIANCNLVNTSGAISGTVDVPVPETSELISVRFDKAPANRLRQWARFMRARYDAASTTDDNRRHWANADNLSATAANSLSVRSTLRKRARYETANNSYAKGIGQTLANHTIGTGPRPLLPMLPRAAGKFIRREFLDWSNEIKLARKLRTKRFEKYTNGESFGISVTNPNLETEVTLDFVTVEADRVSDPDGTGDPKNIDGVILDANGNPIEYRVLKYHPGDILIGVPIRGPGSYDAIPSCRMAHWFTCDRSGQHRGVPDITPALPLFADLRRYTLAVVAAAETAADFAGVIQTGSLPPGEDEVVADPFEPVDIEKRMLMTLPAGYQLNQFRAEQPTTTYDAFTKSLLREVARCVHMPLAIAIGDSGDASFSSSQNDQRVYVRAIEIDQDDCETIVLNPLFREWLREARLIPGYLPREAMRGRINPTWQWDSINLGDPLKVANSRQIASEGGFGNIQRFYAEDGYDCEEEQTAQAEALGMTLEEYRSRLADKLFSVGTKSVVAEKNEEDEDAKPVSRN